MSSFVPSKEYLRGILLHYFIQKKSAADAHRILVETYDEHALSETTCRDWFRRFKNNDFDLGDKERSGAPKKFEDKELEELLNKDPCQTLVELAKSLRVNGTTVSKRLKALGMIQKQGHWVPYELKPRKQRESVQAAMNTLSPNTNNQENKDHDIENFNQKENIKKNRRGKKRKSKKKLDRDNDDTDSKTMENNEEIDASVKNTKVKKNEDESENKQLAKKIKSKSAPEGNDLENDEEKGDTKPEKKPSKRQLKREKAEKRAMEKKETSKLEATQKALNYISKWKHARSNWKFEKLRQIWLMDNLFDDNAIADTIFPIVLEYFEGSKGMAREQLLKKGMAVIKKAEEEEEEEKRNEIIESEVYKRARKLLQAIPMEA